MIPPRSLADRHVLYLHGGGYVYGASVFYRDFLWRIATAASARVLCIDYRLAPEHPFPAAVDDAAAAYRWLLADGARPQQTALVGDSAGGGLVFALLLRLRDEGVPLPAAAVAISPWTDLAMNGQSYRDQRRQGPHAQNRGCGELCPLSISPGPTREIRTRLRFTAIRPGCRHR